MPDRTEDEQRMKHSGPDPDIPRAGFTLLAGSFILLLLTVIQTPVAVAQQQDYSRVAALCDSGTALLERNDIEGARKIFEQALLIDSKYPRAVLGMGRVWLESPKGAERALEYLREATSLMPTSPSAHYFRALAHLEMARTDVGRDNAIAARNELETVLQLDPSHSDAVYQLGILLLDVLEDPYSAVDAFKQQIAANPGHTDAYLRLLRTQVDLGNWNEAVETAEELLKRDPDAVDAYPYLAASHWKEESYEESMQVFERYFARIEPDELGLYLNMGLVLTPEEQEEYMALDEAGRTTFRNHYWARRDPDPKTMVNERLLEHFIRVAYARIQFGQQEWPWDPRGAFYVRYGEPDVRSGRGRPFADGLIDDDPIFIQKRREFWVSMGLSPGGDVLGDTGAGAGRRPGFRDASQDVSQQGVTSLGNVRDPERWVYLDRGIDVTFEDPIGRGKYLLSGSFYRQLADQMEIRLPTVSPEEEKIEVIDPMDSVVTFKGEEGKTAVEYAFALLPDEFSSFRSVTGAYATIDVEVKLFTESWQEVAGAGEKSRRLETIPQVRIRNIPLFVDATRLEVEPGTYRLTTMLMDPETGKRATAEEIVDIPDYSGNELIVSNILPAARITEVGSGRTGTFIRGDLEVLPLPGRALQADQHLFIYYEVYNLKKDEYGATEYQVEYSVAEAPEGRALTTRLFHGLKSLVGAGRRRAVISSSTTGSGISNDMHSYLEIDLGGLSPQTYELVLTVTDALTGRSSSSSLIFRTLPGR